MPRMIRFIDFKAEGWGMSICDFMTVFDFLEGIKDGLNDKFKYILLAILCMDPGIRAEVAARGVGKATLVTVSHVPPTIRLLLSAEASEGARLAFKLC